MVVRIMDSMASHFAAVEVVAGNHFAALAAVAGAGRQASKHLTLAATASRQMKAMDTSSVLVDQKTAATSVAKYPEKVSADHFN